MGQEKTKKKLTKKQKIIFSIIAAVLSVIAIVVAAVIGNQGSKTPATTYTAYEVKETDPLLFKGTVDADNIDAIYYDQTLGKITGISVESGKEVKKDQALLTYQNEAVQSEVSQQERVLNKSSLSVSSAQENVTNAINKQDELIAKINKAREQYNTADISTPEGVAKEQEYKAEYEQYNQALDAQKEVVSQANQALAAAKLDLSDTTSVLDESKGKVSTTIKAKEEGIAYVDEKGKSDMTVPVIKIVSPDVVINGVVSEYDYQQMQVDQEVTIRPVSSQEVIKGKITYVDKLPIAKTPGDTSSMINYEFKVVPEKPIQYGYSVQISLAQKELRIPEKAILKEGELEKVFLWKKGKAVKQVVKTANQDGIITVTEGLNLGDKIISNPNDKLKDGEEVAVTE